MGWTMFETQKKKPKEITDTDGVQKLNNRPIFVIWVIFITNTKEWLVIKE